MSEENINLEFRLKKVDEIRNYLIEEINQNKLMSKKHKKFSRALNYIDNSLIAISAITGCVSISAFAPLIGIPIGITSSAIGLKIYGITTGNKSISQQIRKRRRNMIK